MTKRISRNIRIVTIVGLSLIGILLLAACQSAANSGATTDAPLAATQGPSGSAGVVNITNNKFEPSELTVKAGTTVTFNNTSNRTHTVTADDGSFDSGSLLGGAMFEFNFTEPGEYPYYCDIHGGPGGTGMSGTIIVTAGD
jgi:plastocyanin